MAHVPQALRAMEKLANKRADFSHHAGSGADMLGKLERAHGIKSSKDMLAEIMSLRHYKSADKQISEMQNGFESHGSMSHRVIRSLHADAREKSQQQLSAAAKSQVPSLSLSLSLSLPHTHTHTRTHTRRRKRQSAAAALGRCKKPGSHTRTHAHTHPRTHTRRHTRQSAAAALSRCKKLGFLPDSELARPECMQGILFSFEFGMESRLAIQLCIQGSYE